MNRMFGFVAMFVIAFGVACVPTMVVMDGGDDATDAVLAPDATDSARVDVPGEDTAEDTPTDTPADTAQDTEQDTAQDTPTDTPTTDAPADVPADTRACLTPTAGCSGPDQCCTGLSCRASSTTPGAATYCCREAGSSCTHSECCGSMSCSPAGVCRCVPTAGFCSGDADCCSGVCAISSLGGTCS